MMKMKKIKLVQAGCGVGSHAPRVWAATPLSKLFIPLQQEIAGTGYCSPSLGLSQQTGGVEKVGVAMATKFATH